MVLFSWSNMLSIDIDGGDFHVWRQIMLSGLYRPSIVVIEAASSYMGFPIDMIAIPRYANRTIYYNVRDRERLVRAMKSTEYFENYVSKEYASSHYALQKLGEALGP